MTAVLSNFSTLRGWARGLASAVITGFTTSALSSLGVSGANAVGITIPTMSLRQLAAVAVTGGVVGALAYLKQSPLPPETITETTTATLTTTTTATPPTNEPPKPAA